MRLFLAASFFSQSAPGRRRGTIVFLSAFSEEPHSLRPPTSFLLFLLLFGGLVFFEATLAYVPPQNYGQVYDPLHDALCCLVSYRFLFSAFPLLHFLAGGASIESLLAASVTPVLLRLHFWGASGCPTSLDDFFFAFSSR